MQVIRFDTQVERGIFSSSAELSRLIKEIKSSGFCGYSQCATFLEYYLRTVECPSNLKSIAKLLYQNPYGTFKFGFKDDQAVIDSFGLDNDRYPSKGKVLLVAPTATGYLGVSNILHTSVPDIWRAFGTLFPSKAVIVPAWLAFSLGASRWRFHNAHGDLVVEDSLVDRLKTLPAPHPFVVLAYFRVPSSPRFRLTATVENRPAMLLGSKDLDFGGGLGEGGWVSGVGGEV